LQRSLGGHAIPLDPPTLRCSRRLGLIDGAHDDVEAARASLEHLVPKAKGPQFTDAVSGVAQDYCWEDEPNCPACPLAGECATAQEAGVEQLAGARSHRPKPR
jgi:endonuclease-3